MAKRKITKKSNILFIPNSNYYGWGGDLLNGVKSASGGIGSAIGGLAGGAISGGLESGAGSAISNIGGTIGSALSTVNPVLGGIVSVGSGIIGGVTNKMFGSKLNAEKIAEVEKSNNAMNTIMIDSDDADSVMNQWTNQDFGSNFSKADIGKDGLFSSKAARKYRQLKKQQEAARNRALLAYDNAIDAVDTQSDLNAIANFSAYGGPLIVSRNMFNRGGLMNQHGGDFSNGLTFIDNGGTHEQNPFNGVQIGVDTQGIPNLVEEGEILWNDYVFSNRLKPTKKFKDKYKIKGNTFAEIAKNAQKESEERPNDPISKRGLEDIMSKLAMEQEVLKAKNQRMNAFNHSNIFLPGGPLDNISSENTSGIKASSTIANRDVQEEFLNKAASSWYNELGNYDEFKNNESLRNLRAKQLAVQMGLESGWGNSAIARDKHNYTGWKAYDVDPYNSAQSYKSFDDFIKTHAKNMYTGRYKDVFVGNSDFYKGLADLGYASDKNYSKNLNRVYNQYFGNVSGDKSSLQLPDYNKLASMIALPEEGVKNKSALPSLEGLQQSVDQWMQDHDVKPTPLKPYTTGIEKATPIRSIRTPRNDFNISDLRFAPAVGSAIGAATSLLSKPDYTPSDTVLEAANQMGNYTPISYNPIGNYLSYNPFDRNYYTNKLNAQAGATRRAIMNTSNPSRNAALLAADYNAQGKLGDLARQAEEYNLAQRQAVEQFNRGTNQANAEMGLKTAMANQDATLKARSGKLNGIAQAMQMRDAIDSRRSASISSNLTNLFNNLGNIGKENYMMDMIRKNPAILYDWLGNYKANGGYLTIKHKNRRK